MNGINETHDPTLRSWVESANSADGDFPIQNLPFGVFATRDGAARVGVAIGDYVLDVGAASAALDPSAQAAAQAAAADNLRPLMALAAPAWSALRHALSAALRQGSPARGALEPLLHPLEAVQLQLPCAIGDFTDFYSSIYHATAVGSLFRPDNPLLPNYRWVPIAYHGRASSVAVSGQQFPRPRGQLKAPDATQPGFRPCARLDFELEVGILLGTGNAPGTRIPLAQAESHIFGLCLLNDWSARDVQAWEYQPLGPFLAKSFASTISPWIVTLEALAPYRTALHRREGDPWPLPYLDSEDSRQRGSIDMALEVALQTPTMRERGATHERLALSNFKYSFWTPGQMVTHHASNGCNLRSGDLFGSGTQSGPALDQAGSMLELTGGGKNPVSLSNGEERRFIEDGDSVMLRGWCEREGFARIGFGVAEGRVLPAIATE